jgi:hypothetical protein
MPAWLSHFEEAVRHQESHGIRVEFGAIDPENQGTFIFARSFEDEDERQRKTAEFYGADWWSGISDDVMANVVNYEVRVLRTAFIRDDSGKVITIPLGF